MVSIALLSTAVFAGVAGMIEHPAFLGRHVTLKAPSIWRLCEFLRLMALPCSKLNLVRQVEYGMKASRPTHFASWHVKIFDDRLRRHRAPADRSEVVALSGRTADGTFRTAVGKEYPPALCEAITGIFFDFATMAEVRAVSPVRPCTVSFNELVRPFIISLSESPEQFGDDYVEGEQLPLLQLPSP